MKKIYSLLFTATVAFTAQFAQAQCTIDNNLTTDFATVTPQDAGTYCQNATVDQNIQILTIDEYQGFAVTSITISGISNAPAGLTSNCSSAPCNFPVGNDGFVRGCININGTPTQVFDDSISLNITINTLLGSIPAPDSVTKARIIVKSSSDASCVVGLEDFEISSGLSVYPNPGNGSSNVNLNLPEGAVVRMSVYDVLGNKVFDLHNGFMSAGDNSVQINGLESEQGMYLLKVEVDATNGTNTYTERLIIE